MCKKLSILLLILLFLLPILLFTIMDFEKDTASEIIDTQLQHIEKETIKKGIDIYTVDATVLGRYENKIYLDMPILNELDTESGQVESFPDAKNIHFISVNADYLVGVNHNTLKTFNRKTKQLLWDFKFTDGITDKALSSINNNTVYFATNNRLLKFDVTTGKILWGNFIYNGIDTCPVIHIFKSKVAYFGDTTTYIFEKEKGELLHTLQPIRNPHIDQEHIYFIESIFGENPKDVNTVIKRYSVMKNEMKVIGSVVLDGMNNYLIGEIINIGKNGELIVETEGLSNTGIISLNKGNEDYITFKNGKIPIYELSTNRKVRTGYFKGNFIIIDEDGIHLYNMANTDYYNIINDIEEYNKKRYNFYNIKLIDGYLYLQNDYQLWEINLDNMIH